MKNPRMMHRLVMPVLLMTALVAGCGRPSEDMQPLVNELARKQAAQQESLLRQSEELTEASRRLVESDAEARKDLVEFQSQLQEQIEDERRGLDRQRDGVEQERREIAWHRHRDPLIAAALIQVVTLAIAALPFLLVVLALRAAWNEPADVPLGELLADELSSERPMLLPRQGRGGGLLEHDAGDCDDQSPGAAADVEPPF